MQTNEWKKHQKKKVPDWEKEHSLGKLQLCTKTYTVWKRNIFMFCMCIAEQQQYQNSSFGNLTTKKKRTEYGWLNEYRKAFWYKIQNYKSSQMQFQSCSYSLICFQSLVAAAAAVFVLCGMFAQFMCAIAILAWISRDCSICDDDSSLPYNGCSVFHCIPLFV